MPIKVRQLGRTGLRVSELALGCMTFGAQREGGFFDRIQTTSAEAEAIVARALDAGIDFIDTADVYGDGASEEFIGRALAGRRRQFVLATKVGGPMGKGPRDRGLSRAHVIASCEASLRRLKTDFIDLYQVHWADPATPIDETLRALDDLVRSGKVRYLGASNFGAYLLTKSLWESDRAGLARFDCLQPQYSLLVRDIEDEILPMCQQEGLGVVVWSPLAQGFLSGKYQRGAQPPQGTRMSGWDWVFTRHDTERQWQVVETVKRIAERIGRSSSQVALAWLLTRPGLTSIILGARTVAHLEDNLGASEVVLSAADLQTLTEVSAPPTRYPMGGLRRPD